MQLSEIFCFPSSHQIFLLFSCTELQRRGKKEEILGANALDTIQPKDFGKR